MKTTKGGKIVDAHPKHARRITQLGKANRGFTLIELLVAIAILAILIAMAAPSFTDFVARSQVRTCNITFQADIRYAQDQARTLNQNIRVATLTGEDDWQNGYTIWVDDNNDGSVGNNEQLLRQRDSLECEIAVRDSAENQSLTLFEFENSGMLTGLLGLSANVCSHNQQGFVSGRTLSIMPSGLVQVTDEALDCSGGA